MKMTPPLFGQEMQATDPSQEVLRFMNDRRSNLTRSLAGQGPKEDEKQLILRLAARAPDHRKLFPWRFLVFENEAREKFGEHLAEIFKADNPDADADKIEFERKRFLRAPLIIGVVSSPKDCPKGTPVWEQELSAGAVCMNMLITARALGYGANWLSEWYAFDKRIDAVLGLEDHERIAGFVYIGRPTENPPECRRPDMEKLVQNWPIQN